MSKKTKKNKKQGKQKGNGTTPAVGKTLGNKATESSTLLRNSTRAKVSIEQLESNAAADGLDVAAPGEVEVPKEDEETLLRRLQVLKDAYKQGKARNEQAMERLDEAAAELDASKKELKSGMADLESDRTLLNSERASLAQIRGELADREEEIMVREADADAGFAIRRDKMLQELEEAHQKRQDRNRELFEKSSERAQSHFEDLVKHQEAFKQELLERRRQFEEELSRREEKITVFEDALRKKERALAKREFEAETAIEGAEDIKEHVEEHIRNRAARQVTEVEEELSASRQNEESLRERIVELEKILDEREAAANMLEHRSPEEVKRKIDGMRLRISELEEDRDNRPTVPEGAELLQLRIDRSEWERDRAKLLHENGRLESQIGRLHIEVDTQEILRERNRALLTNQELLRTALDDLQSEFDQRIDKKRDRPVFPQLLEMDEKEQLNTSPPRLYPPPDDPGLDLEAFAEDMLHRIGLDPEGERPDLYFRPEDIRAFLGGLAMSRMHLLQGISGIGKSSLPRAFAGAVGGFCDTVSVQAGWRDRNDLFGYFNTFDNRYQESTFVQALYKARLPQWRDRIAIILLDEMNLSHPEQYAADLLDVLERDKAAERRFELMPFSPDGKIPSALSEARFLSLPDNVWFVGTANHDETTKDFADKTYDRSFVLELPGRPQSSSLEKRPRREPIACEALLAAFDKSSKNYSDEADRAIRWMEEHLRNPMSERFRVGWGGRLEKQIKQFVPVVLAAGGSLGEALDQLVTSRVLRKICDRHDLLEEDLVVLSGVLEQSWPDKNRGAKAALSLVKEQQRRV